MVNRPLAIIVIIASAVTVAGVWVVVGSRTMSLASVSRSNSEAAKQFFGTPKKYDMTNGQEMRPRW